LLSEGFSGVIKLLPAGLLHPADLLAILSCPSPAQADWALAVPARQVQESVSFSCTHHYSCILVHLVVQFFLLFLVQAGWAFAVK
jgi:hypothetical protein